MQFLADESVPHPIIERLRADGFTVHAIAAMSPGAPDKQVLSISDGGEFILITLDRDFGEVGFLRQLPVRGVVLIDLARMPLAAQVEHVARLIAADRANLAANLVLLEPEDSATLAWEYDLPQR